MMLGITGAAVIAILLGGALYQARAAAKDLRDVPAAKLVNLEGGRLHVHCSGAGWPAVILEAGIAASSLSWTLVQPRVAEFSRACSYDRAGLGWSDAGSWPRLMPRLCMLSSVPSISLLRMCWSVIPTAAS